ncbi:MAG: hypothetical protein IT430_14135 [Phycisphaerales bacterium]|nr:hypothetical protein [Phycisphaerales bacterium]
MANPAMVVRIAANLAELKKNLAEGRNQIEATTAGMQKLATSFQGDRLIQAAHNVAAAVNQIGGASNLTEREQAKVNRTVEQALEKYRALGKDAPEALKKLAADTAHATEKTSTLATAAKNLFALFSARAIINAANDAIAYGGKISDLASKAGMTAEAFQRMGFAAGQSGVPVERLADGAVQLSKRLVEGEKSSVAAVKALGLSMSDLIASGPERALYAIGDAIATVPNPMEQAAIATNLFGRTGADFLPAFKGHMQEVADASQRAGLVLSEDTVRALDSADDSFARVRVSMTVMIGQALEPMLPLIETLATWLGNNLPAGLQAARAGFDALILVGLRFRAWLLDTSVSIAQAVADVPVLGRVFGESSGDIAEMARRAQEARDAVNSFVAQGVEPTKRAVETTTPPLRGFGAALHEVTTHTKNAKDAQVEIAPVAERFTGLVSRSLTETGKLTQQLETWARVNGAQLAPSILEVNSALDAQVPLVSTMQTQWAQFAPTVAQNTAEAARRGVGLFQSLMDGLPQVILGAVQGGGSVIGAAGTHIGTSLMDKFSKRFGPAIKAALPFGIGEAVTALLPTLGALFGPVAEKIAGFFKKIFGGPSAEEVRGREAVAAFEQQLASLLNQTQRNEAGNESWKQTVIAIRDAYLAAGRTEAEALRDAERLWQSSKQGAEASKAVIAEIEQKMHDVATAAADTEAAATDALDGIGASGSVTADDVQAAMARAMEATRVASETGSLDAQIAADIAAQEADRLADEFEQSLDRAGAAGAVAIDRVGLAIDHLPDVVDIEIRGNYQTYGAPPTGDGYAAGTMGAHGQWFRNFGPATATVLHGREAVVTPQQAPAFAQAVLGGGWSDADAELKRMLRDLPRSLKLAIREAMAMA